MPYTNQNENLSNLDVPVVGSKFGSNPVIAVEAPNLISDPALKVEDLFSASSDTLQNSQSITETQVLNHTFAATTSPLPSETLVYDDGTAISNEHNAIEFPKLDSNEKTSCTPQEVVSRNFKALETYYTSLYNDNNKIRLYTKYSERQGHIFFLETFEQELFQVCQKAPQFFKMWFPILLKPNPEYIWIEGLKPNKDFLIVDGVEITYWDFQNLIKICENIIFYFLRFTNFYSEFIQKRPELDVIYEHPDATAFTKTLIGHTRKPNYKINDHLPVLMAFIRSLDEDYAGYPSPYYETIWKITSHSFNPVNTFGTNKPRTLADLKKIGEQLNHILDTQILPRLTLRQAYFTEVLLEEYSHIAPGNGDSEFANTVTQELNRMINEGPNATFNYDCLASWYNRYSKGPWLTQKNQLSVTSFSAARKKLFEHPLISPSKKKRKTSNLPITLGNTEHTFKSNT